jgi:DinB family protein
MEVTGAARNGVLPADIQSLAGQLAANGREAAALVDGLAEELGARPPTPGAWSVAECLDHLATANRVYLGALRPAADRARRQGERRRGPAEPGLLGGWFVRSLEPPAKPLLKLRAPRKIRPRSGPPLAQAYADFQDAHRAAVSFLHDVADLDLAHVRFVNPFIRGVRFSLATGLHVIAAHERRHLWQARRARRAVAGDP